jgi:hypothetical protein
MWAWMVSGDVGSGSGKIIKRCPLLNDNDMNMSADPLLSLFVQNPLQALSFKVFHEIIVKGAKSEIQTDHDQLSFGEFILTIMNLALTPVKAKDALCHLVNKTDILETKDDI